MKTKYTPHLYPFFIFFSILFVYFFAIIYIDNTNITTTNGLYKSFDVQGWADRSRFNIDSGGILYAALLGEISKAIPHTWMQLYGTSTDFITYRKLAFINGFFGAAASLVVFLLAFRITHSRIWASCASFFHAFSGYIFVNSIISEDIIPGYFFYILGIFFFYQAMTTEHKRFYLTCLTATIIAVMTLHWTLFPPAAAGYVVALFFLVKKEKTYVRFFIEQVIIFFILIFLLQIMLNFMADAYALNQRFKINHLLFPAKAHSNQSWLGWSKEKIILVIPGMGNYLLGGKHFFSLKHLDNLTLFNMAVGLLSIIASLIFVYSRCFSSLSHEIKVFSIFIMTVFFVGEIESIYATAQDPQFQIQSLFLLTYTLIIAYFSIASVRKFFILPAIILALLMYNFYSFIPFKGNDSKIVKEYKDFRENFKRENTKVIFLGYEGWATWLWVFDYKGSWDALNAEMVLYANSLSVNPDAKGEEIASFVSSQIDKAYRENKRIIATTPWIEEDNIYNLTLQKLPEKEIDILKDLLLKKYKVIKIHNAGFSNFAELAPR